MTRLSTLAVGLAATALLAVPAAAQPTGDAAQPLVRADAAEAVSAHAFVILDLGAPFVPNVGFVVGDTGVLVIDTGLGERNGRTVLVATERLAPGRDIFIVATHFHPEHDLGAQAFPDEAQVIRSNDQIADVAEAGAANIERFSSFSAANAELLEGAYHREADIVFADEHRLDLGGVTVRILAMGPNHTRGDTAVFVEGDNVLFSGDVAMGGAPAFATPESSLSQWQASLDRFDALAPGVIVPAHGPLGDAGFIAGYRAYMTEVAERAAAQKAEGRSVEEAVAAVTAAMSASYPNAGGRLGGAVRVAYAEAP
jgi:glyoxylase-like metal-dependent hydrolase (beta-lactamase superfamily II)